MIDRKLVFLIFCVTVFFTRCTKDDIPSTPGGPFLFSSILITKNTTPTIFTSLTAGQAVNFKVGVAYTLDTLDQRNIKNVVLNLDFDAVDSSFAFVEEIGTVPPHQFEPVCQSVLVAPIQVPGVQDDVETFKIPDDAAK